MLNLKDLFQLKFNLIKIVFIKWRFNRKIFIRYEFYCFLVFEWFDNLIFIFLKWWRLFEIKENIYV